MDDTLAATRRVPAQRKRIGDAVASAGRIARPPHGWKGKTCLTASQVGDGSFGAPGPRDWAVPECLCQGCVGRQCGQEGTRGHLGYGRPACLSRPGLALHTPGHSNVWRWTHPSWNGSPRRGAGRWTNPPPQGSPGAQSRLSSLNSGGWGGSPRNLAYGTRGLNPGVYVTWKGSAVTSTRPSPFPAGKAWRPGDGISPGPKTAFTRRHLSESPARPWTPGRTPPLGSTPASSLGAPGTGTVTPGLVSTLTRAAACARIPCKETPLHQWWVCPRWDVLRSPEGRKLAIPGAATDCSRGAYGSAGSCRRRPRTIAPPIPPRKPTAASRSSASSRGSTSSTRMLRLCAPRTPILGGQHAPSGPGTTSQTRQPGPCPGRSNRCTAPNSSPS